jgi:hypothetical protein
MEARMSTTEIIPVVKQEIEQGVSRLRREAEAIMVTSQSEYIAAVQIKNDVTAYIKDVKAKLGPGIDSAKSHLDRLKNDMAAYITPAQQIADMMESKRIRWAEEEKRKTAEEERRINEERRLAAQRQAEEERRERERIAEEQRKQAAKEAEAARRAGEIGKREAERLKREADAAAEREKVRAAEDARIAAEQVQEVKVKPSVPTVAGVKNQTYYYAEMIDPLAIIRAYETAKDPVRIAFLRRFIQVNEQELGKFAREEKDNAKASAQLPGVRFWSKG